MSTLAEIKAAADSLSTEDKESLLRFLSVRLRKERVEAVPRIYTDEEVTAIHAEDEAEGAHFRAGITRQADLHAGAWEVADDFDAPLF